MGLKGAYGISLSELAQHEVVPAAEREWPEYTIEWSAGPAAPSELTDRVPVMGGGELFLDNSARRVLFSDADRPSPAAFLHPWLSLIATVVSRARGFDTFHAGGVVIGGKVWAFLGEKEAGKTSTLAWLAQHGWTVTSDDLVVIDGDRSYAGPGCLDLREEAARHLGLGTRETLLPGRDRWRVWLPSPPASTPFGGFILPEWGREASVEPVPTTERVRRVIAHRAYLVPQGQERRIVELCAFPMFAWRRPRDFAQLPGAATTLVRALEDAAATVGELS